jgi:hypothetical protein
VHRKSCHSPGWNVSHTCRDPHPSAYAASSLLLQSSSTGPWGPFHTPCCLGLYSPAAPITHSPSFQPCMWMAWFLAHLVHTRLTLGAFQSLLLFICLFVCLFETGSHYVSQAGLQLERVLPQPPECWDDRDASPCPASTSGLFSVLTSLSAQLLSLFYCSQGPISQNLLIRTMGPCQGLLSAPRASLRSPSGPGA